MIITHTSYENGMIKNAQGKLIAFYAADEQVLYFYEKVITGVRDIVEAMEYVGANDI